MFARKCTKCGSNHTKKVGRRNGIQRYYCHQYHSKFQLNRRPKKFTYKLFKEYFYHRQTLKCLADKYGLSIPTVRKLIKEHQTTVKEPLPRDVIDVIPPFITEVKSRRLNLFQLVSWWHTTNR